MNGHSVVVGRYNPERARTRREVLFGRSASMMKAVPVPAVGPEPDYRWFKCQACDLQQRSTFDDWMLCMLCGKVAVRIPTPRAQAGPSARTPERTPTRTPDRPRPSRASTPNQRDREAERVRAEIEEFERQSRDHLVAEDIRRGLLVSWEAKGATHVGRVVRWGRRGATVAERTEHWQPPLPPLEWTVTWGALQPAAWEGAHITARCGDGEYTLRVTRVEGAKIVGVILAGDFGLGEDALVYAREVVAVRDDGETWA